MKLKICVLISICLIFFIRIFYKEATPTFNKNLSLLFGVHIEKMVIYVYQILAMVFITSIKKINVLILIILLLINLFLIICYCISLY